MSSYIYYAVFNQYDNPVEVVRVSTDTQKAIVIAPRSSPDFAKQSCLFNGIKPRLDSPYCFQLIHAGNAGAPKVDHWLNECNAWGERSHDRRSRGRYSVPDAKAQVIQLIEAGVSVRETERLTGVPKSTVQQWKKSAGGVQ